MKRLVLLTLLTSFFVTAQAQDPRWGYALQFNGTTNFATADALCAPLVGKDFTIEFWFKLSGTPSDFNALAVFNPPSADVTDNRIETGVGYGADQKFYVYSPNSGTVTTYGTTTITVGTWYHVAITYTYATGNIVAYLNGQQELTKTIPASDRIQSNDRFSLGQEWDNSSRSALFHGELDEVRIWDDIRTISELNYNRYSELAGTDANLLAYYKMSDGSGTSLTDDSPNSYTGTLVNGTAWVSSTVPHPYAGGTGISGNPYQIANISDLVYLSQHSSDWAKYFIQTANIYFGSDKTLVDWNGDGTADGSGTAGFSPIGNGTTNFTGNYNAQNHTISNLYISRSGIGRMGLFGATNGSTIANVGLVNAFVIGGSWTGALVGDHTNGSSLTNCYSTGSVTGSDNVGGLVGYNQNTGSTISNCYSQANVSGAHYVGGLVGMNNYSGVVNYSFSTGQVSASSTTGIGGLVGLNINSATTSYSFWDTQTSGMSTSAGGTGLTTAQMKTASSFTGWDFATTPIWNIKTGDYISYPYLYSITYDTPGTTPAVNPLPGLEDARMILTYTVPAGATIGLPLNGTVNVTIDWGDGNTEAVASVGVKEHTYAAAGTYTVKIGGTLTAFGIPAVQPSYSANLTGVVSFGNIGLSSLDYAFYFASSLTDVPGKLPASVTVLSNTFFRASNFNDADIVSWDVSQVTNMSGLFSDAGKFNQPIGSWNVGNVTDMSNMFSNASDFNQVISSWNVSKVTNMYNMFSGAGKFNQPIGSWNVGNVTTMAAMFNYASVFNQNISSWDVSKVTDMRWMFFKAFPFNQNLANWNVKNVTTMQNMFSSDIALSTTNYDAILNGWAALAPNLKTGVTLSTGPYFTSAAVTARQTLTGTYNWTITDGGMLGAITGITASNATPCTGTSVTLTAAGTLTGSTVHWYTGSCGGTELTTGLSGTNNEVLTVSPTATTTYYAKTEIGGTYSSDCASATVTVSPLLQYRSKQTGTWETVANWEQYNGSGWIAATSYPGQITNSCANPMVTIRNGHTVQVWTAIAIPNLTIEGTGQLQINVGTGKLSVANGATINAGGKIEHKTLAP